MPAGVLVEARGTGGDAVYTRVEQLIEAGSKRAGREDGGSLAPENEPPLASVQDMIRQVRLRSTLPCALWTVRMSLCSLDSAGA